MGQGIIYGIEPKKCSFLLRKEGGRKQIEDTSFYEQKR